MRKLIALILATIICLSMAACGTNPSTGEGTNTSTMEGTNTSTGDTSNNKTQSITETELVGEWYEVKSADRLVLNSDGSLEYFRNNQTPFPGYWKLNNDVIEANNACIDSDLAVEAYKDTLTLKSDEYTFMQWIDLPKDKLSAGDSGQRENIKITLNNVVFTTEMPNCLKNSVFKSHIEQFALQDDMTYAKISVDIANMSKSEINIPDVSLKLDVILDYNNGFRYATHDNQKSFFVTDTEYVIHDCIGGQTGTDIQIQPLQAKSFDIYIPCAELIAEDESAPLAVGIISHYDSEIYYCEYSIR